MIYYTREAAELPVDPRKRLSISGLGVAIDPDLRDKIIEVAAKQNLSPSVLDVAKFILSTTRCTPLKLQKLLFYCYAYHLVMVGQRLFTEKVVAWQWGPVVSEVYEAYKHFDSLETIEEAFDAQAECPLSARSLEVISSVLEVYGELSGMDLMQRTHSQAPWIEAWEQGKGTVLDDEIIKAYYKQFVY